MHWNSNCDASGYGKKAFFLYPHSVVQDELLTELIVNEYEVYVLKDHKFALNLLERFPESFLFINIDEGLKEAEWEAYIKQIQSDEALRSTRIGILSYNTDKTIMHKYLMELAISCGFIQLKLGVKDSTRIILEALKANEAKGRRQFIRANCTDDPQATLNFQADTGILRAKLLDISSAGLSCRFEEPIHLKPKSLIKDMQLRLHGSLARIDGVLLGARQDDPAIAVIIFDLKTETPARLTIQKYVRFSLQKTLDQLQFER